MKRLIAFAFLFFLAGCSLSAEYNRTFLCMGTIVNVKTIEADGRAKAAMEAAIAKMQELEGILNRFNPKSELYKINARAGKGMVQVSDDICKVLDLAIELNEKTYGTFDVTIAPLEKAWGLYDKHSAGRPEAAKIEAILKTSGTNNLQFDREKKTVHFKNEGMELDFAAIAKGYVVDEAIKVLEAGGVKNAIIEAGGDLYCLGKNRQRDWKIGIRDPRNKKGIVATVSLSNKAAATSGGYENFIELGGKKYPHIIDPRTGFPAQNKILSATVIAEDCATADGLATAFFILDPEESLEIAEKENGIDCIIITEEEGSLRFLISSGIKKRVKIIVPPSPRRGVRSLPEGEEEKGEGEIALFGQQ